MQYIIISVSKEIKNNLYDKIINRKSMTMITRFTTTLHFKFKNKIIMR